MTKIVYRNREEGYYCGRTPEEPTRMGLRGDVRPREQNFCRGIEREHQSEQYRNTYTDEDFDMYRDDAPHRRTTVHRGPSKHRTKCDRTPLWIICSLISAVGLFSIFSNVLSVNMLNLQLGSFSPFELLLGGGSKLYEGSGIMNPKLTAATAAAFGASLFLFLRNKEGSFDMFAPALILSIIPAGVMIYFIYSIANAPINVLSFNVGLGAYLQIICSAGLTILTLIGHSMSSKNGTKKGMSCGFR